VIDLPENCVARVRAGDLSAFEGLYRAMHAPLLSFAERYVGDSARAEELVQDLFFELWQNRMAWSVQSSISAYLYAAVRNRGLNVRRRDVVEADWAADEAHEPVRALHAAPITADVALAQADLVAQLNTAITRLPERCRMIMQMRWHGGLSYAEIAEVLSISLKGVENQLSRGLRTLRSEFTAD
jgi:RNA polymerase sigma-70 factor, ECF subfamily